MIINIYLIFNLLYKIIKQKIDFTNTSIVYQYEIPSTVDSRNEMTYCGVYAQIDQVMNVGVIQVIIQIYTNYSDTSTAYWSIREFILKVNGFPNLKNLNDLKFSNNKIPPWKIIFKNAPILQCGSNPFIGGSNALDKVPIC
ncbi:unnamed protein product [Paramecium pentaurelia]|uniref:Uncharacterized protein n=1 Tax=Paramecium pentaurelia TaxID=43138 RepID=A0A8S1VSX0_9CILI|nr:unnamed protein product [Paramecium pentaurelia]